MLSSLISCVFWINWILTCLYFFALTQWFLVLTKAAHPHQETQSSPNLSPRRSLPSKVKRSSRNQWTSQPAKNPQCLSTPPTCSCRAWAMWKCWALNPLMGVKPWTLRRHVHPWLKNKFHLWLTNKLGRILCIVVVVAAVVMVHWLLLSLLFTLVVVVVGKKTGLKWRLVQEEEKICDVWV